ncbi:hypothetical protein LshimejAT787_0900890 [Lyophyllum shimeji]|uniref:Uncharacterized protein n=1 Tax=Lyophyllum shimeji TaxID=47721 RepID=A0A9P3PST1_LYOSH|nr:hypothetical protein LshimejAT787_0900890 [Lyophyllum shimeji]
MPADPSAVVPLRGAVLSSLAMAWAWGVIAGSVGLNALIKSNQQKSHLRKSVPRPTIVTIDTDDVFQSGVVLTVVGALIAVLSSLSLLSLLVPHSPTRRLSARSLRLQSFLLAFCAAWLFATLVPFTVFFANRSAQVSASVGSVQLPQSIIKQAEQALGTTSVYKRIGYLRLVAILPWITLLFTVVASGVLFVAGSPARRAQPDRATHDSTDDEKGAASKA